MKGKCFQMAATVKPVLKRERHPKPAELAALAAGRLTTRRAAVLRRHLRNCVPCALTAGRFALRVESEVESPIR
jgi:hypothetical protein